MRGIVLFAAAFIMAVAAYAEGGYLAKVDLNNVQDDYLFVEVFVPAVDADEVTYNMPKVVPGTYSISDFGRFLSEFKAWGADGEELEVEMVSTNTFRIKDARKLKKVSYWVEDSYDTDQDNVIFEPAGTNIEKGKNFVLNTFGFFGYLDGMKNVEYDLEISYPKGFFGASSLPKVSSKDNVDRYHTDSYVSLADCPIMYCEPDTATLNVGGAEVLVSVYSPNDSLSAKVVMENISPVLLAAREYLGGKLPVDQYAFLIYLMDGNSKSGGMGALEHMTSSMYTLPELGPGFLGQTLKDIAAHEFFHIVTPLNIHSEEIGDFDFVDPEMSRHLWLYEGVTEYTAHHVQVGSELITPEEFLRTMKGKIRAAGRFTDDLAFTELSLGCLDEHEGEYGNVYQKGALIGMCLDLKLRDLSDGEYGLPTLMADLSKKYGMKRSFKDEELFGEITAMTYPEIGVFLQNHVADGKPLPLQEYLDLAGVTYMEEREEETITLGGIRIGFDEEANRLKVANTIRINDFGKELGYLRGDRLISLNGKNIDINTAEQLLKDYQENTQVGDKVTVVVERKDKKGNWKQKKLKAKAIKVKNKEKNVMEINPEANDRQKKIFKAWLQL